MTNNDLWSFLSYPYLLLWGLLPALLHLFLFSLFRLLRWFPEPSFKGARRSDILAFKLVAQVYIVAISLLGSALYFGLFPLDHFLLRQDRLYASSQLIDTHLLIPMLYYQIWNTFASLLIVDLREPLMVAHHVVVAALALCGRHPFLHYYALFFFGLPEISNVFLCVYDIFRYFPEFKFRFNQTFEAARALFVLTFFVLRLVIWPYFCLMFWVDSIQLLQAQKAHSVPVVLLFLLSNVFMTGLQFFWGFKILNGIAAKFSAKHNV